MRRDGLAKCARDRRQRVVPARPRAAAAIAPSASVIRIPAGE